MTEWGKKLIEAAGKGHLVAIINWELRKREPWPNEQGLPFVRFDYLCAVGEDEVEDW